MRLSAPLILVAAIFLFCGPPAWAGDTTPDPDKYIPRAEYEKLKRRFEDVVKRLDALEKLVAPPTAAPAPDRKQPSRTAAPARPVDQEEPSRLKKMIDGVRPGRETARLRRAADPTNPHPLSLRLAKLPDLELFMGFSSVGRAQYLPQDKAYIGAEKADDLEAGFQTPFANVSFLAQYQDALDVYFDFYIATRSHPDYMQGGQGYLLVKQLPQRWRGIRALDSFFNNFDIKAGGFEVDYGDAHYRRSNAGQVQQNPLIGNYVVDPRGIDLGVELINHGWPIKWLVGFGSGTYEGHFDAGGGYAAHAKLWIEPSPALRLSVSGYHADHSGDGPGWPGKGTVGNLFRTNRSGGAYDSVFGGGDAPGQLTPGGGQLVTASQADLTLRLGRLELYGYFGWMEDADVNGDNPGTPEESWWYYAGEWIYNLTDRLYAAGRYSGAAARYINDASSGGLIHRFSLGGGYWLFDNVLLKLEGVYQTLNGFSQGDGQVCGVDAWRDPEFYGVITEASFAF